MLRNLIISRTDSLGDVVLTLPTAGLMKKLYPGVKIYFIGRSYTQPVIQACEFVDEFVNWDEVSCYQPQQQVEFLKSLKSDAIVHVFPHSQIAKIAYQSKIPIRIGTSHRWYHWLYCNKNVPLGRKNSDLHETQLNLQLFCPLGAEKLYRLDEISGFYGLSNIQPMDSEVVRSSTRPPGTVVLAHISQQCNTNELAERATAGALLREGFPAVRVVQTFKSLPSEIVLV